MGFARISAAVLFIAMALAAAAYLPRELAFIADAPIVRDTLFGRILDVSELIWVLFLLFAFVVGLSWLFTRRR